MEEKKPRKDKRGERTKLLISDALQTLLQSIPFSGITVNDICMEAEVSRTTFYLHFEDKYRLLHFTIDQWGTAIARSADLSDLRSLVGAILETLYDHRKEIHNIVTADKNEEVQNMVHIDFVEVMTTAFEKRQAMGAVMNVPVKALSVFCAAGITYMILWWLEGGIEATKDEMCDYLVRLAGGTAIVDPL